MTNSELVSRFLGYYGHGAIDARGDITPVAPFILMDMAYQSYCKHIAPLPVKGMAKRARSCWEDAYRRFNKKLFLPFAPQEWDDIVDRMDDIEEFLREEGVALEEAIFTYLEGKVDVGRDVIASVLLSNILSQAANELVRITNSTIIGRNLGDKDLDSIRIWCIKFANFYLPLDGDVNTSEDIGVCKAVSALSHKIAEWIFKQ